MQLNDFGRESRIEAIRQQLERDMERRLRIYNPMRIPKVLEKLNEAWLLNTDLRLGQLLENLGIDFFTYEEETLRRLEAHIVEGSQLLVKSKRSVVEKDFTVTWNEFNGVQKVYMPFKYEGRVTVKPVGRGIVLDGLHGWHLEEILPEGTFDASVMVTFHHREEDEG